MVYCGRRGIIILIEQFPMTTYRDLNSTGDTMRWLYDEATSMYCVKGKVKKYCMEVDFGVRKDMSESCARRF